MKTLKHLQAAAEAITAALPQVKIVIEDRGKSETLATGERIPLITCSVYLNGNLSVSDHPIEAVGPSLAADIQEWFPEADFNNLKSAKIEE